MLHRVSGTTSHLPGTVYGLSLKTTVIFWLKFFFELNLPQVGKMKRKFGPRPSQEVRLNPGQSRSERQPWKVDCWICQLQCIDSNHYFHTILTWRKAIITFEGGPKKRENAGDASRRVRKTRKTTIFVLVERDCLRMPKLFRYIATSIHILNVNLFFGSARGITSSFEVAGKSQGDGEAVLSGCQGNHGDGLDGTGTFVTSDIPGRTL